MIILDGKTYALFGSDEHTNPFHGDTDTNCVLPLLGIKQTDSPAPVGLPCTETRCGKYRAAWCGGKVIIVPQVHGRTLISQMIADEECRHHGVKVFNEVGFRMAEWHDGDAQAGCDFWADTSLIRDLKIGDIRYWVSINDQPANPWEQVLVQES